MGAELEAIVGGCKAQSPALVGQVLGMMREMERITVLAAEQWHAALYELQVSLFLAPKWVLDVTNYLSELG